MRNIAVFNGSRSEISQYAEFLGRVEIDGIPVTCGLISTPEPDLRTAGSEERCSVLVRVNAFSCNYRDKALILSAVESPGSRSFYVVGSDFVGEVVDVGPDVANLKIGERVIGNNNYSDVMMDTASPRVGIPTNHASKEFQLLREAKLVKIPPEMPTIVAAAFSIGAQTSYSIIRKLNKFKGAKILVTAARSNTSLFIINALAKYQVRIFVTTTSSGFEKELQELGVEKIIRLALTDDVTRRYLCLKEVANQIGRFDYVVDPFFNLHIGHVLNLVVRGGKYITCGFSHIGHTAGVLNRNGELNGVLLLAVMNNLEVIGNCLGQTEDLTNALQDYRSGSMKVIIDSVFDRAQIRTFFEKTFAAKDRFGKVVYVYR